MFLNLLMAVEFSPRRRATIKIKTSTAVLFACMECKTHQLMLKDIGINWLTCEKWFVKFYTNLMNNENKILRSWSSGLHDNKNT